MTGAFNTEPIIGCGGDIIADFVYLRGHRLFHLGIAAAPHDSPHLWMGDYPAVAVNDHGTSGLADLQATQKARQLGQGNIDAEDENPTINPGITQRGGHTWLTGS